MLPAPCSTLWNGKIKIDSASLPGSLEGGKAHAVKGHVATGGQPWEVDPISSLDTVFGLPKAPAGLSYPEDMVPIHTWTSHGKKEVIW